MEASQTLKNTPAEVLITSGDSYDKAESRGTKLTDWTIASLKLFGAVPAKQGKYEQAEQEASAKTKADQNGAGKRASDRGLRHTSGSSSNS